MTKSQRFAIECAFADLVGAYQAHLQGDIFVHDWDAHRQSIQDLIECFDFIDEVIFLEETP